MELDIIKEIKLNEITLDKETLSHVLKDIKNGNVSRTKEPVMVMYDSEGDLIIFDGFHRTLEHALVSEDNNIEDNNIEVHIIFDERDGTKCEDAHRINKENKISISADLVNQDLSFAYSKNEIQKIKDGYLAFKAQKDRNPFVEIEGLHETYKSLKESGEDHVLKCQRQREVNTLLLDEGILNLFTNEELEEKFNITELLNNKELNKNKVNYKRKKKI